MRHQEALQQVAGQMVPGLLVQAAQKSFSQSTLMFYVLGHQHV
jgi:hypothetical protein